MAKWPLRGRDVTGDLVRVICIWLLCANVVCGSVFCTSYERLCVHCVYGVFVWVYMWFLVRSMRALVGCFVVLNWPQDGNSWAGALTNQHYGNGPISALGIEPIRVWHAQHGSLYISSGFPLYRSEHRSFPTELLCEGVSVASVADYTAACTIVPVSGYSRPAISHHVSVTYVH